MISKRRRRVGYLAALACWWIAMTIGSHWPRLDIGRMVGFENDAFAFGLDKWLHITAYAGLAWLLLATRAVWWALPKRPESAIFRGRHVAATLLFAVVWAGVDELAQLLSPGREVWWTDWGASMMGVGLGGICWGLGAILTQPADSFVGYTRIVAVLTLISRFFGLARDVALAYAFGRTPIMDAFAIAFLIPNLFRRLFGEGALAAAFIPQYRKLSEKNPQQAATFGGLVIGRVATGLLLVPIVGIVIVAILLSMGSLSEKGELAAGLSVVTLWYAPLICAAALIGAMLQSHGRFGPSAAAPVVLNILMIVAALIAAYGLPDRVPMDQRLYFVAASVVVAGVVQVLWQWTAQKRATPGLRLHVRVPDEAGVHQAGRGLLRQWLPTVFGLAVFQVNVFMDGMIAMFFSGPADQMHSLFGWTFAFPMEDGAVITLGMAQRLYEFPLGVFGIAVATAIYPSLSAAAGDRPAFTSLVHRGLRLTMFIALPASVGLMLVRGPLCRSLYGPGGALTEGDAEAVAEVLLGYAPAIWAFSLNHILTRSFYAQQNAVTPVRVAMGLVALNVTLNLILIWPLGTAGLAWSTSICAAIQTLILLWLVRRYADRPLDGAVLFSWLRMGVLSAAMAAAVILVLREYDSADLGRLQSIGLLLGSSAAGAAVFGAMAAILRMPELRWLLHGKEH